MTYKIVYDTHTTEQLESVPAHALPAVAETMVMLGMTPWNGDPYHELNPDGAVRQVSFGGDALGLIVYLILEDQARVDVLEVFWLGD